MNLSSLIIKNSERTSILLYSKPGKYDAIIKDLTENGIPRKSVLLKFKSEIGTLTHANVQHTCTCYIIAMFLTCELCISMCIYTIYIIFSSFF